VSPDKYDPGVYRLIHDPSNAFRENRAVFHSQPWADTLKLGMWPPGSIWRIEYRDGTERHVIVEGHEFSPQHEVAYTPSTGSQAA
jgi:hypothetical protein